MEQRLFVERRKVVEIEAVGDFKILVARQIEQRGQAVIGGARQRFGINQVLTLVLQFDVGSYRVYVQTDSCFLQFPGLVVEPLRKRDTCLRGVAGSQSAKNEKVLVHGGVYHNFARGLFIGPRLVRAFAADLVRANFLEVQDGLRKRRAGLDDLIGTEPSALRRALDALNVVLVDEGLPLDVRVGKQRGAGNLTIAVAFGNEKLRDDTPGILLKRELHGLFQRELQRCGRGRRLLLRGSIERQRYLQN